MDLLGSSTGSPTCFRNGTTFETNSLTLVEGSCCAVGGSGSAAPSLTFLESNGGATAPFCLLNDITAIGAPLF